MSNGNKAIPEIIIECRDRPRRFCMDHFAYRAMETHYAEEVLKRGGTAEEAEEFSIFVDFDWTRIQRARDMGVVLWAGFQSDASANGETLTMEQAQGLVDLLGVNQCMTVVNESITRSLPTETKKKIIAAQVKPKPRSKAKPRARSAVR